MFEIQMFTIDLTNKSHYKYSPVIVQTSCDFYVNVYTTFKGSK